MCIVHRTQIYTFVIFAQIKYKEFCVVSCALVKIIIIYIYVFSRIFWNFHMPETSSLELRSHLSDSITFYIMMKLCGGLLRGMKRENASLPWNSWVCSLVEQSLVGRVKGMHGKTVKGNLSYKQVTARRKNLPAGRPTCDRSVYRRKERGPMSHPECQYYPGTVAAPRYASGPKRSARGTSITAVRCSTHSIVARRVVGPPFPWRYGAGPAPA